MVHIKNMCCKSIKELASMCRLRDGKRELSARKPQRLKPGPLFTALMS